ncbi:MAG: nucleoside deaminase [Desulfovibrio sp.]|jgi:tRNA(adenine34) deaminase|nr:nucleoside deaminase [Desulfovibrio sp.]
MSADSDAERWPLPRAFSPVGPLPQAPVGHTWESLMDAALEAARQGARLGEIPVGALVAEQGGRILACSHNASVSLHDPTAHAEILALRAAGKTLDNYRLAGCVLVVTLEPCPMCAAALVHARLDGLVFGAADARAGAVISRAEYLDTPTGHRLWHLGGVRAEICAAVLRDFFAGRRAGKY